jgi:hypothetical protein
MVLHGSDEEDGDDRSTSSSVLVHSQDNSPVPEDISQRRMVIPRARTLEDYHNEERRERMLLELSRFSSPRTLQERSTDLRSLRVLKLHELDGPAEAAAAASHDAKKPDSWLQSLRAALRLGPSKAAEPPQQQPPPFSARRRRSFS